MACLLHRVSSLGLSAGDANLVFAEPGVEPHYGPSRTVSITHLALRLELDPAGRRWSGEARFTLAPLPGYAGRFHLDLAEVTVQSVTDGEGLPLPWSEGDERLEIRALAPSVVVVRWTGENARRGLYFTGPTPWLADRRPMAWTQCQDEDAHFVFPCFDHPGTKHPWSIELRGPKGFTLLSNGERAGEGTDGDRAWARFEQREPMPAYLFTAVCAELAVRQAPPVRFASGREVAVRYLVPVGEEEAVDRAFGKTPVMIDEFSRLTGVEYPWPRYDQVVVHDFVFGGMENIACTTMIDALLVTPGAALEWDPDALVAHELAHQWFGDLVTCQDWSQGWLNESWATFMEFVWWELDRPAPEATWYRYESAESYQAEAGGRYRRPIVSYDFREPIDVFDRHLYEKGGCVLATLRAEIGTEGFWAGVKRYLHANRHGSVHTHAFQRALEGATGRNLDRFFQQWILSPGHPQLQVKLRAEDGLVTAVVKQTQGGDGVPAAYHLSLRLAVVFEDGSEQVVDLPVRERERAWAIPTERSVACVRVDPGFRVLADIEVEAPEAWLVRLLGDACPVVSFRAAKALVASDTPKARAALFAALREHRFYGVREKLAELLAERGADDGLAALLAALPLEADPRVQRAICTALGAFRDPRAADALLARLGAPMATPHLHGAILAALGKTRDPRALPAILAHLDTPSWHETVRGRALAGLAATEDVAARAPLESRTSLDYPDAVRGGAAGALARLADVHEPIRRAVVERLVRMLREPGFRAQLQAIDGLGVLRDPTALGPLAQVHRSAPDGRTRRMAYEAMAKIRRGRTTEEALGTVKKTIEQVSEENHKLRARIEKLEGAPKA